MPRPMSPVTMAGQSLTRLAPPRVPPRHHRRPPTSDTLQPHDVGLGKLFVHTRDAIVVGNLDTGRIALWNPAAERLFGWSADEAVGRPIEILIPPAVLRLHQAGLALYRRTGQGALIDSGEPMVVPALTSRGQEIEVELSLVELNQPEALHSIREPGVYVMAILRDASDRRRAEVQSVETARAESARREAQAALRDNQRLVQDGADDIRKELNHLQRSVERLTSATSTVRANGIAHTDEPSAVRSDQEPGAEPGTQASTNDFCSNGVPLADARLAQLVTIVQTRADRVRRKLDQLATLAAIQADQLELAPERVNLVPLVSRVVADVRSRGTPCKLNVAMPQGLTANVDPQRIEQVVRTLLELAVTRNPHGCWIDVELRRPLVGLARLEIRDTGRAISDALRDKPQDRTGTDQELQVCRSVVELHGGTLDLDLPADGGVRVVVTLPTQRARVLSDAG